jgi:hypothetical protein
MAAGSSLNFELLMIVCGNAEFNVQNPFLVHMDVILAPGPKSESV